MKLGALLAEAGLAAADGGDAHVTGFAIDHRKIAAGTVFGAFQGATVNGEDFVAAAEAAGAVAVVARPEAKVAQAVHIADAHPRKAFARLAAQFFQPVPGCIVAVTGTNGKTSVAEMVRQIWRMSGNRAASIGTLGVTTADESVSTGLTSPDIVTFLSNLTGLAREGVSHVPMRRPATVWHNTAAKGRMWRRGPSPISAAITSITTRIWMTISLLKCGCLMRLSRTMAPP
jgi:UDP-N-acetylmuramoyl-L-alanyl-D-glutamate--2,6-diaminopimelate ligase